KTISQITSKRRRMSSVASVSSKAPPMAFLTTRLTIAAAVALVAIGQVAISPASCCLLRAALARQASCCQVLAKSAGSSCCQKAAGSAAVVSLNEAHLPGEAGDCPICSAGPKLSSSDRTVAPSPEAEAAVLIPVAAIDVSPVTEATSTAIEHEP